MPMQRSVLELARTYWRPGRSIIPVRADGSKAPCVDWKPYQTCLPTAEEIERWFAPGGCGLALIGGKVSGGHFVLDIEFLDLFEEWKALLEAVRPGLLARLPLVRTPGKEESGGRHVHARCTAQAVATAKLARITRDEAERRTGDPGKVTAIEVKGEKGYVLLPGSPAACHESGRLYEHLGGPPVEEAPDLDPADARTLLDCAKALERGDKAQAQRNGTTPGDRPGDDFNRRADWMTDVLTNGWKVVRQSGEVVYLCRPGKDAGVSATVGYCKSERAGAKLYVFTSNAEPLEPERAYSKFETYALLHHAGDWKAAAKDLAAQGYGSQAPADAPADPAPGKRRGRAYDVVRADWVEHYAFAWARPDEDVAWSTALGRLVSGREACRAPRMALAQRILAGAPQECKDRGGKPRLARVPAVFRTWAPVAWADVMAELPDEPDAAEVVPGAQEDFRRRLLAALTRQITLGAVRDGQEVRELRAVVDWCKRRAVEGNWRRVRSWRVWSRLAPGNGTRDERLRVAVVVELFGQIGCQDLKGLSTDRFVALCEMYGCGKRVRVGHGGKCGVELTPEFLAEALAAGGPLLED
jgi:hypothetical protein